MSAHSHKHKHGKMKGVHTGTTAFSISVKEVPIPKIINRTDAIIRPTSAGICGSDLHILHGRIKITEPLTLGHEIIGIVEEIGDLVHDVKKGDRVLVTSLLSEETDDEISVDLGVLGYPFGTAFNGGQAELVRVHFASDNCLVLPPGTEHELDYVALSDIFCTANWALDAAGFQFTDVAVVFGAGPVGLLCAYSAFLRGASKVYSVDRVPQRLAKAKSLGAIPIDFSKGDPAAQILKLEPNGVDRSCDCSGWESVNAKGENVGNIVLIQAVAVTRIGGGIGLIGGFVPDDPGASTADAKKGIFKFPFGDFWEKSQTMQGGAVPIRKYQLSLKKLIESGRANPGFIFDKEIRIEDAGKAYVEFSDHDFVKAVIRFGDDPEKLTEDENGEKVHLEKKRKRNGVSD